MPLFHVVGSSTHFFQPSHIHGYLVLRWALAACNMKQIRSWHSCFVRWQPIVGSLSRLACLARTFLFCSDSRYFKLASCSDLSSLSFCTTLYYYHYALSLLPSSSTSTRTIPPKLATTAIAAGPAKAGASYPVPPSHDGRLRL